MYHKNYTFKIFSLSFLFFSSSIFPMFASLFAPLQNWCQQHKYKRTLKRIETLTTVSQIDSEIDTIKNNVYEELLTELEHNNFSKDYIKNLLDDQRFLIKEILQKNVSATPVIHDSNIPQSLYNSLLDILAKEKINPNNIHLKYQEENQIVNKGVPFASTIDRNYTFISSNDYIKSTMRLYKPLLNETQEIQKFVFAHEIQHLLLRHKITSYINTKNVSSIQEREANIHAASKDIAFSHTAKNLFCSRSHPDILDGKKHCRELTILYTLMKKRESLYGEHDETTKDCP